MKQQIYKKLYLAFLEGILLKALITSKNDAKINAANNVLSKYFKECEIISFKTNSGISATPSDSDEAINGCFNRIVEAHRKFEEADLYISFEGLIERNNFGTFVYGWCLIQDSVRNRYSLGASSKVLVPEYLAKQLGDTSELSEIVRDKYDSPLKKEQSLQGSNGLFTNGMYSRVNEFEDALNCALGYLNNEQNYIKGEKRDFYSDLKGALK
jgi:inosine/xanthosine triphosphatase